MKRRRKKQKFALHSHPRMYGQHPNKLVVADTPSHFHESRLTKTDSTTNSKNMTYFTISKAKIRSLLTLPLCCRCHIRKKITIEYVKK